MNKAMNAKAKIAYLAPELPSISETFVYNEILELEKQGLSVTPISVRRPGTLAAEEAARRLADRTTYLYALPRAERGNNVIRMMKSRPGPFVKTLLLALRDAASLKSLGRVPAGVLYRFFAASTAARVLLENECSHLHAHFAHVPADIAMYASLITGIPFSFTSHANDLFVHGWLLKEKIERSAFAVTISEFNRKLLMDLGADGRKIHVVHCGVDPSTFVPREPRELVRPVRIGSLGRMVEKKGFDLLLDACGMLRTQDMKFVLELAGDGPLKQELTTRAAMKGLGKDVVFLGPMSHDKVSEWLKGLDVFALACKKDREGDMDGIPVVLMEAMLSGVPVVSTRVSGIPELIGDKVTGWLADKPDAVGFATALHAAILDGGVASGILANAQAKVREEFDLSKNARTLARLYLGEKP